MTIGLILSAVALATAAILVTRLIERVVPETLPGLGLLAVVAFVTMWLVSALGFAVAYQMQDAQVLTLFGAQPGAGARHFAGLGVKAGLIWAPIVLLVVVTAPRRWKNAVW